MFHTTTFCNFSHLELVMWGAPILQQWNLAANYYSVWCSTLLLPVFIDGGSGTFLAASIADNCGSLGSSWRRRRFGGLCGWIDPNGTCCAEGLACFASTYRECAPHGLPYKKRTAQRRLDTRLRRASCPDTLTRISSTQHVKQEESSSAPSVTPALTLYRSQCSRLKSNDT